MKKVLIAFDGTHFSEGAFRFVQRLNELQPILLTGAFIPQTDYATLWSYAAAATAGAAVYLPDDGTPPGEVAVEANIRLFEELCVRHGIHYRVHRDFNDFALPELRRETRFADLLVLSGELFYQGMLADGPLVYLEEAVRNAECPVLVLPEDYAFPDNNIIAYDGSAGSVFALKQFAYLLPELAELPTLLVYGDNEGRDDLPARGALTELAAQHYPDLSLFRMKLDAAKYFRTWLQDRQGALLITGSFGRGGLGQLWHRPFALDIIRDHKLPVFIAHR